MAMFSIALCLITFALSTSAHTVLVTGATGRSGRLIYSELQQQGVQVRGLVRDPAEAKKVLNCGKCGPAEGIFVGDVTKPDTLVGAVKGVDSVAIAVGTTGRASEEVTKNVEWLGVINQVRALAEANHNQPDLFVALISSMGTTDPNPKPFAGGKVLFWKLQAEAFLSTSGIPMAIVKPCGLVDSLAPNRTLLVGHNDELQVSPPIIRRQDVARVVVQAILHRHSGLRFDVCSKEGPRTTDLEALLQSARWSWQQ
uniref:NAD(P)-binding domain-containing protein n=1 Tax=Eutreptiella gymnastica TaxID=73025 RepID=A0A7S4FFT2_9EUGL